MARGKNRKSKKKSKAAAIPKKYDHLFSTSTAPAPPPPAPAPTATPPSPSSPIHPRGFPTPSVAAQALQLEGQKLLLKEESKKNKPPPENGPQTGQESSAAATSNPPPQQKKSCSYFDEMPENTKRSYCARIREMMTQVYGWKEEDIEKLLEEKGFDAWLSSFFAEWYQYQYHPGSLTKLTSMNPSAPPKKDEASLLSEEKMRSNAQKASTCRASSASAPSPTKMDEPEGNSSNMHIPYKPRLPCEGCRKDRCSNCLVRFKKGDIVVTQIPTIQHVISKERDSVPLEVALVCIFDPSNPYVDWITGKEREAYERKEAERDRPICPGRKVSIDEMCPAPKPSSKQEESQTPRQESSGTNVDIKAKDETDEEKIKAEEIRLSLEEFEKELAEIKLFDREFPNELKDDPRQLELTDLDREILDQIDDIHIAEGDFLPTTEDLKKYDDFIKDVLKSTAESEQEDFPMVKHPVSEEPPPLPPRTTSKNLEKASNSRCSSSSSNSSSSSSSSSSSDSSVDADKFEPSGKMIGEMILNVGVSIPDFKLCLGCAELLTILFMSWERLEKQKVPLELYFHEIMIGFKKASNARRVVLNPPGSSRTFMSQIYAKDCHPKRCQELRTADGCRFDFRFEEDASIKLAVGNLHAFLREAYYRVLNECIKPLFYSMFD